MEQWSNLRPYQVNYRNALRRQSYLITFDTETTGLSKTDKIVQLSSIKSRILKDEKGNPICKDGLLRLEEVDRFDELVNPFPNFMSDEATIITGITMDMLHDRPKEDIIIPKFMDFCGDDFVFMGHNSPFDIGKINSACERLFRPEEFDVSEHIDTLKLARAMLRLKDNSLSSCAKHFNLTNENDEFHNSMFDVEMTLELGKRLLAQLLNQNIPKGNIQPVIFGFFEFKKSKAVNRTYVTTSKGQLYYDRVTGLWGAGTAKQPLNIDTFDMEYVDRVCQMICDEYGIKDIGKVKGELQVPYELRTEKGILANRSIKLK